MYKDGYKESYAGTTRVRIGIDDNGYIAPEGTTPAGSKNFTFSKVNADNSLADNTAVLEFLLSLVQGQQDSLTNKMTVSWDAEQ